MKRVLLALSIVGLMLSLCTVPASATDGYYNNPWCATILFREHEFQQCDNIRLHVFDVEPGANSPVQRHQWDYTATHHGNRIPKPLPTPCPIRTYWFRRSIASVPEGLAAQQSPRVHDRGSAAALRS